MLDNTVFYMSSDIGDGNSHNHWDMPVLLAGGASGKLKLDGSHGIMRDTFGEATGGPLPEIMNI